jgi:ATP:ADP antiporter, AAA family
MKLRKAGGANDAAAALARSEERLRLLLMMGLFFLVVCAVGILRPIKNSLALDGLGSTDFFKVYFVSAFVVLFVPIFNRLSDRFAWKWLLPGVALFFALNLVQLRLAYVEGSAAFGLIFYGWYDLFAAALVTQFFMATQLFFDARSAKKAYPLVIAGGSLGATLGGAITGFFAESVGTPNLLLVAAALIMVFALAMPWVWGQAAAPKPRPADAATTTLETGELRRIFANRHVRLIALTVLMTVLVKQLVDFQYNALTKEVFETRDAVSAFQGKFNAATQWLPLVVLAGLRPALRRWGVGAAVLLLPLCMLATTGALAVTFGLWAAVAAKGSETALRYSAERAGREILYVPVPDEIKLKAKAYIDVAIEKGLGKVLSALLLGLLLSFLSLRQVAYVSVILAVGWFFMAVAMRREYVRTLARAIEGRFASLRGLFMALTDASSLPVLRAALNGESPLRSGFALDLLRQAPAADVRPVAAELNQLATHAEERLRAGALEQLSRIPELADEAVLRGALSDANAEVREHAVRALVAKYGDGAPDLLRELLASDDTDVRLAALQYAVRDGGLRGIRVLDRAWIEARRGSAATTDAGTRAELALAAAGLHDDPDASAMLDPFLDDGDARVRASALRSAALMRRVDCCPRMIAALATPATRSAAEDALVSLGAVALEPLAAALMDERADIRVRRAIPRVLARIPTDRTVTALIHLVLAPETDQLLDYRTIKALSKLRARHPSLRFDAPQVREIAVREADAAAAYAAVLRGLEDAPSPDRLRELFHAALRDAWHERREGVFRCLGLIHPAEDVHRAFQAVANGAKSRRANALEWLESTIGHDTFVRLRVVFEPDHAETKPAAIETLNDDGDAWVARLARTISCPETQDGADMELIEKVFLLQRVDLLRDAPGAHLALLASIAEEIDVPAGRELIAAGEATAAMYVVTRGEVVLEGAGEHLRVGPEDAFGTWALIDEQPSPLAARTALPTRLLRITRSDFHDLLADHSELAIGMMQALARRMRSLVL